MVQRRRPPSKNELSAKKLFSLLNDGLSVEEVVAKAGCSPRHAREANRVRTQGVASLKHAVQQPRAERGVMLRLGARLAVLPKKDQRRLLPKVRGTPLREGLRIIEVEEDRLGQTRRGRKPMAFDLATDARKRASEIVEGLDRAKRRGEESLKVDAALDVLRCLAGEIQPVTALRRLRQ